MRSYDLINHPPPKQRLPTLLPADLTPSSQHDSLLHSNRHSVPLDPPPSAPSPAPTPNPTATDRDAIRCICAFTHDDGLSIACDDCGR